MKIRNPRPIFRQPPPENIDYLQPYPLTPAQEKYLDEQLEKLFKGKEDPDQQNLPKFRQVTISIVEAPSKNNNFDLWTDYLNI